MLVYEKKVEETNKIFGTMGNIPSDNDEEVTYKDSEGQEITPALTLNETYLDDGHGGIIRKLTGQTINAFVDGVQIIPAQKDVPPTPPTPVGDAYLTFSSDEPFSISTELGEAIWDGTLEYSTDTENWTEWDGTEVNSSDDGKLYFRGSGNTVISMVGPDTEFEVINPWVLNGDDISCSGNIETLLDYRTVLNNEHPQMGVACYCGMFSNCTSLTTPSELPATTLAIQCYANMFNGCTSLTSAPELPATTLVNGCYSAMFYGCTALTTAPELPATTLASYCYQSMFYGCTSLTTPPELPVTTLAHSCYDGMFHNCTSLTTPPELPATTLAKKCYSGMLDGCTSLTSAPELPVTTLAEGCYAYMFRGCTSLTIVPELPATTLTTNCYYEMFCGCTSLTTPSELPATTLAESCYFEMFKDCTSLTIAPELPATTLAEYCYQGMFSGCTSIKLSETQVDNYTISYRVPSTGTGTDVAGALENMFYGTGGTFKGKPTINTTYYLYDYSKDNTETIK